MYINSSERYLDGVTVHCVHVFLLGNLIVSTLGNVFTFEMCPLIEVPLYTDWFIVGECGVRRLLN